MDSFFIWPWHLRVSNRVFAPSRQLRFCVVLTMTVRPPQVNEFKRPVSPLLAFAHAAGAGKSQSEAASGRSGRLRFLVFKANQTFRFQLPRRIGDRHVALPRYREFRFLLELHKKGLRVSKFRKKFSRELFSPADGGGLPFASRI
jgi:hypothetical protein